MKALSSLVSVVVLLVLLGSGSAVADPDPVGVWPLSPAPEVVHDFDPPDDPWGSGHRGVDLAGTVGQPVLSALDGTVAYVGTIAGRPVVTITHGDTRTTYEPVSSFLDVGTPVTAGQAIGSLELALSHCFPRACLHWGWRRGDTYLDPLGLVGDTRVRLLPLWRDQPVDHDGSARQVPTVPAVPLPYAAWSPTVSGSLPGPTTASPDARLSATTTSDVRRDVRRLGSQVDRTVGRPGIRFTTVRRGGAPGGRPDAAGRW